MFSEAPFRLKKTILAISTSLALAACGGGGGGSTPVQTVDNTDNPPITDNNPPVDPNPVVDPDPVIDPDPVVDPGPQPVVNSAPTVANPLPDQEATEDSVFSVTPATDIFADADGDSLTVDLAPGTALPAWLSFDASTFTFFGTPANEDIGAIDITVTASDGTDSISDTFTLTVIGVNDSPSVAAAIGDRQLTHGVDVQTLGIDALGTFADEEGDPLTLTAALSDGGALPAWLTFDGGTFSGTPTSDDVGIYEVAVSASDGNLSATDMFTLTVGNTAPQPTNFVIAPQQFEAGEVAYLNLETEINAAFIDQDPGDILTYTASGLPASLQLDVTSLELTGAPVASEVGDVNVTITATDAVGDTATTSFTLSVVNNNPDGPIISGEPSVIARNGELYTFNALVTDPDGDIDSASVDIRYQGEGDTQWISGLPSGLDQTYIPNDTDPTQGVIAISGTPNGDKGKKFNIWIRISDTGGRIANYGNGFAYSLVRTLANRSAPVFADNFNDGDTAGWTIYDDGDQAGIWGVSEKGVLEQTRPRAQALSVDGVELGTYAIYEGASHGGSFELFMQFNSMIKNGDKARSARTIGVMFGYQDPDNYYRLEFSKREGHRKIVKRENGVFTELATSPQSFVPGEWNDLRLVVHNNAFIAYLNGEQVLSASRSVPNNGKIGLVCARSILCRFDDVIVLPKQPDTQMVGLVSPSEYAVYTGGTVDLEAVVAKPSGVGGVRFVIDGDTVNAIDVLSPPYTATANFTVSGEHVVEARLLDTDGATERTGVGAIDVSPQVGVLGIHLAGIGDSIVGGWDDDIAGDNISSDGRNTNEGFQPILNDLLSAAFSVPVTVIDEGNPGENSAEALARIDATLARTSEAQAYLVIYGANDSRTGALIDPEVFKSNLQGIIDAVIAQNKKIFLAKAPPITDPDKSARNDHIGLTNAKIDELLADPVNQASGLVFAGPDFNAHFLANPNELSVDGIHPNGVGYQSMGQLWFDAVNGNL